MDCFLLLILLLCVCWVFVAARRLSLAVASGLLALRSTSSRIQAHSLRCSGFIAPSAVPPPLASHCSGFSCCRAQALGTQASVVAAHRLSYSVACGIFLGQRSNLCPLHWQVDCHPLYHQGSASLKVAYQMYN